MWNVPGKTQLAKIPKLYETEDIPLKQKIVHFHFFISATDFYVIEYDGHDTFWGFVIIEGDNINAEFGYFSFEYLKELHVLWVEVDTDLYWKVRPTSEVPKIRSACGWQQEKEISKRIETVFA